ncbi:MAG: OmpH family outer membrane protein [Planctomycetes bacterium]|nr:OmpH family outer membrane protein [Planctomycetota bacterium]
MKNRKIPWPFILVSILLVTLCSGFIFDWGKKKTKDPNKMEAVAKQKEKLAAQDQRFAELNEKIAEQARLLAEQQKKFAELAGITKRLDEIQANLKKRKVDINDSDMSMIQETIKQQVKLNVRNRNMPKAGVVSIREIFRNCKKVAKYRQESTAERQRIDAELTKLGNEIKAQKAGLKILKNGSENYLAQVKEILEKQALLQAQQEFYKQQVALKEQRITESIYGEILRVTGEIAKQKDLDWVFEKSEPEFPALSPTELELSMGMHKLLYGGGCLDITNEVMAQLDSEK